MSRRWLSVIVRIIEIGTVIAASACQPSMIAPQSIDTMSPASSVGASICSIHARNAGPSMGPSSTIGAVMPPSLRPPTNVVVFQ